MPLYEYACSACGHGDTLLEKVSAARRKKCPECGKARAFERQLSAPAFHLKGSGWYETDFKNKDKKPADGGAKADGGGDNPDKADKADKSGTTDKAGESGQSSKGGKDGSAADGGKADSSKPGADAGKAGQSKPAKSKTAAADG